MGPLSARLSNAGEKRFKNTRAIRFRYVCAIRGTSARAVVARAGEHAASLFQAC